MKNSQLFIHEIISESKKNSIIIKIEINGKVIARLISLTNQNCHNNEIILDFYNWRKKNKKWFPTQFIVTKVGTKNWLEQSIIKNPNRMIFFLCSPEGKRYGHLGLSAFDYKNNSCELDNIVRGSFLLPGSMQYAVSTLVEWVYQILKIQTIYLRTFSNNVRAISLYKKTGFVEYSCIALKKIQEDKLIHFEEVANKDKTESTYHLIMKHKQYED